MTPFSPARPAWRLLAGLAVLLCTQAAHAVSFCTPGPGDRPETGLQGSISAADRNGPDGFQGFWCGVSKVAQHTLFNRGSFGDLQHKDHCVYASMRDPSDLNALTTGTAVLDVSVPSNMAMVPDTSATPNPNGRILRTRAMIRAYSALELQGNLLVGAFKDFGPTVNGVATNPLDIYDVSDCANPVLLSDTYDTAGGNHDGWLTPDGRTYYGIPFGGVRVLSGTETSPVLNPARNDMHVTDLSDPRHPRHLLTWNRLSLPAEVLALNTNVLAATNFHDVSTNQSGTRVYMALYGGNNSLGGNNNNPIPAQNQRCSNGLLILDSSDIVKRVAKPQLKYVSFLSWCDQQPDPDFGDGSTASAHATEYVIHENGKEYIVSTDESGGGLSGNASGVCAQRTYGRMIDISDEKHPKVVGTFKPDVNKPENCAANLAGDVSGGMIHYLGFDDRYHMRMAIYAGANQGMRFVDWRDPANPKEVAYYVKPRHTPGVMDFVRPDPRYDADNCLYYTGWNQGGLVSLELNDPEYNNCLRKRASGSAVLAQKGSKAQLALDVQRAAQGPTGMLRLSDSGAAVDIRMTSFTRLGSAIGACGPVQAQANAVQIDGTGTYNGAPASFRVCVQDTGDGSRAAVPDRFHLTCTAGCAYTASGAVASGNLIVRQQ